MLNFLSIGTRQRGGFNIEGIGDTRYLIGADGPNSAVAKSLDLGQNRAFEKGNGCLSRQDQPVIDVRSQSPASIRAGMIPCGGVVKPVAAERCLLVGDAAGMVSPVTAGGIHTALKHGLAAGHAISDLLNGKCEDPHQWFPASYPKFRTKRWLRFLFDHFQNDTIFNLLLATKPMRMAASQVYFHKRSAGSDR